MESPVQPEPPPEAKSLPATFWLIFLLPTFLGMSFLTFARGQGLHDDIWLLGGVAHLVINVFSSLHCGRVIAERSEGSDLRKNSMGGGVSVGLFIMNIVLPVIGCCVT